MHHLILAVNPQIRISTQSLLKVPIYFVEDWKSERSPLSATGITQELFRTRCRTPALEFHELENPSAGPKAILVFSASKLLK